MRRPFVILGAVAALALVVALLAPAVVPGLAPGATPGPSATLVPDVPVDDVVLAEARAIPIRTAALSASVAGTVSEIRVAVGGVVRAGDVLVLLDPGPIDAEIAVAQAAEIAANARAEQAAAASEQALQGVAVANAGVTQATAGVGAAEAARDLLPEDAVAARVRAADAEVEIARAALSAARSQLAGARAALTVARRAADAAAADAQRALASVASLELTRAGFTLVAPFDGTVAAVPAVAFERVVPGVVLVHLADSSGWRFETTDLGQAGAARCGPATASGSA